MSIHAMSPQQASQVKRRGHAREKEFNLRYGNSDDSINYSGASADCNINVEHPIRAILEEKIGTKATAVSLKGGNTIQIHLGNLPELTDKNSYEVTGYHPTTVDHGISFSDQCTALKNVDFWNRYLKKGDILAYSYDNGKHIFFNMDDVIQFICDNCKWRKLETGRLKGDFGDQQILTYEYRSKKNSFVLGAHGAKKGKQFIKLLETYLRHHIQ